MCKPNSLLLENIKKADNCVITFGLNVGLIAFLMKRLFTISKPVGAPIDGGRLEEGAWKIPLLMG